MNNQVLVHCCQSLGGRSVGMSSEGTRDVFWSDATLTSPIRLILTSLGDDDVEIEDDS